MTDASDAYNEPPSPDPRPQPPVEPDDCCGSGCITCVYDLYWKALEHYEAALQAWEARQRKS